MNLDPLSFSLARINQLVGSSTKENSERTGQELSLLVSLHGAEADKQAVRRAVSEAARAGGWEGRGAALLQRLLAHPARASALLHALDRPVKGARSVRLSPTQEAALCLALLSAAEPEARELAAQRLRRRLPELVQGYLDAEGGGLRDCGPELLQPLLAALARQPLGLAPDPLLRRLRRDFPRDLVPVILAPLLYPDGAETPLEEMTEDAAGGAMEGSVAELVREMGYSFTASLEECKMDLLNLGGRDLAAVDVARLVAMMARHHTGLGELPAPGTFWLPGRDKPETPATRSPHDSWNLEVFVQTLKELYPNLNWKEIILQLDHPDFLVKDRQGLNIIFSILRSGIQNSSAYPNNIFPVEYIYRHWTNVEGQMSLISQIIKNPDIFCFGDHPHHPVAVDILKSVPESDNKEISNWRSLYLVELLLYLGERGFYNQVQELFMIPIQQCPDVLLLALLQINPKDSMLRHELISNLIPIFLSNHPNSAIILHHAWHSQNPTIKPLIMRAMADWYLRGENDQSKLSRILDVAQDLKALSLLLNINSFMFVIDLACLASRREYLKLDKWLTDKIREHGESFITTMVKFLQRRCPQVVGGKILEEQLPKAAQLPQETITTMLGCVNMACVNNVQPDLMDRIIAVNANCAALLNKPRQVVGNLQRPHRILETPFNPGGIGGQIFNTPAVDNIIAPNFANMNLGAPGNTPFSLPSSLGPLVSTTPGSPSRLMAGPSSSPFMMPLQHGGNLPNVGMMNRMGTAPPLGKQQESQIVFPEIMQNVSKDIEDEANGYFQRIYNHPPHPTLSIDEVLDMLKKFQDSPNKREREVYSCMLRNLFEEYRFFPQYPDKELHITAQLFGGIIERGLVTSYMALGLALKFVLEALRKQAGSKMYYFGIAALDRFKSRLKDYHKYCEHVRAIEHFFEFPHHLKEYVEYGLQGQEPPTKPQGPMFPSTMASLLPPAPAPPATSLSLYKPPPAAPGQVCFLPKVSTASHSAPRPSIANATNIDTLLVATGEDNKITSPPDSVQDKSAFIFNNLSQLNLQTKCDELRDIITEEYWPWLSQYLVMKRASIELNFHTLYSNFLDVLKIKQVNEMVTRETFRNINVLLRSDKGIANFSDRSLLKNLGHWLGMLTLGRNRPILQIDIDLKSLILEAYHKGQQELLYVVPFVAKVLESCDKSKVFKPPNPWTMSIMNVLAELHQEPDLKLNLKFEIEVLCKNLNIDVADLKPAVYLRDSERAQNIEYQLSGGRKEKEATPAISQNMSTPTPTANMNTNMIPEDLSGPSVTPTSGALQPGDGGQPSAVGLPEPRFNYADVNLTSNAQFGQNIVIHPQVALLQSNPHLKNFIKSAIERSIQEWIHPVVDRSIKYALTTCEQIIRKDFALDCEEVRMRQSAHHMMRNLTAGMAMITCREQLLTTINTNLKTAFLTGMNSTTPQQKEIIEAAALKIANDNMELACAIIQKTAVEKALPELDKRLMNDYDLRKIARQEGRRYFDTFVLNYQADRMPERCRLKVGIINDSQIAVYEEFARNIPGFITSKERETTLIIPKAVTHEPVPIASFNQSVNASQMGYYGNDELGQLISESELYLGNILTIPALNNQAQNTHNLLDCLLMVRRNADPVTAFNLLQKTVEGLLDGVTPLPSGASSEHLEAMNRFKELHIRALKLLQDTRAYGIAWTNKHVTRTLTECREELRYNTGAVDCLIRSNLVNLPQYDAALVQFMDGGSNYMAVAFAMQLVQLYLVDDRELAVLTETDVYNTIEVFIRMISQPRQPPPDGLAALVDSLRANRETTNVPPERHVPTSFIHSGVMQVRGRDHDDPPGLTEKTEFLLRDWVNLYHNPPTNTEPLKTFNMFVQQMNHQGILKTDDLISRFFRIATQLCIDNIYSILEEERQNPPETVNRNKYYHMTDAYVRLVALLIKNSGETGNTAPKINLLCKVLGITAGWLLQDHEEHGTGFQQLPYSRILLILFLELNQPEPVLESINYQLLKSFCHTLNMIGPAAAPGFAYAWIDFVSHRAFISRMLAVTPQQKGWGLYSQLLVAMFRFIGPFLRNTELAKPVTLMYKGILKVLLVLLHDFPEFLCDYHYAFCDEIPPNCIQMRNLILSAFPRNMRLPDPFTPNLKVDLLVEITQPPRVMTNFVVSIQPISFKNDLDAYLKSRAPVTFLSELRSIMQVSNEPGKRYNIQLMNAVVVYVGTQAISFIRGKGQNPNMSTIAHSAHMDIFQNLAVDLDHEGRYIFLNAIANQLRYPNSHTHYFSCALLYLFAEANTEAIQEQITRMLLERLIVNRPHPWGLLITFIELIKNTNYKFWEHDFVHCATEIEKLFESVARSCMVDKTSNKQEIELAE